MSELVGSGLVSGLIVGIFVAIFNVLFFNKKQMVFAAKQNQEYFVFEKKAEIINEAMKTVDIFISWIIEDCYCEDIEPYELTVKARKSYNDLVTYCDKNVVERYTDIFFGDEGSAIDRYQSFRKACRNDLKINEVNFSEKEILFYRKISTTKLNDYIDKKENNV